MTNAIMEQLGNKAQGGVELEKVFLALRTDVFGDLVEDEHITLKYWAKTDLLAVTRLAKALKGYVPTEIRMNGFPNWTNAGMFYGVALVDAWSNPILYSGVRTPHITIRKSNKPLTNATFIPEIYGVDMEVAGSLWIGKKIKGKINWVEAI